MDNKEIRKWVQRAPFICPNCNGQLLVMSNNENYNIEYAELVRKYNGPGLKLVSIEDAEEILRESKSFLVRKDRCNTS